LFFFRNRNPDELCKLVFLPIELKNREFHAHILLAANLVRKGYRVVIGSHAAIFTYMRALKDNELGGVYLDKSTQIFEVSNFISKKVDAMLILDQELSPIQNQLGVYKSSNVVEDRFYEGTKSFIDGFFTVGPELTAIANQVLPAHKIIESGWPRFELLEHHAKAIYETEITEIRREFGDFCLFVSSFSLVQSLSRCRTLKPIAKLGWITDNFTEDWWQTQFSQLDGFVETLIEWRKIGFNQKIVIRPHLYEDLNSWKKLVKNVPNVHVVKKGEINSWLFAASSVLHRGSTVSIQAALINKPTFSLPEYTPDEFALSLEFSEPVTKFSPPPMQFVERKDISNSIELSKFITNLALASPSQEITRFIDSLKLSKTPRMRRARIFRAHVDNQKSLRRGLGLIKDEIRRFLGFDVGTTVSIALPWGLSSLEVRRVLSKISVQQAEDIQIRQISVNLIELIHKSEIKKGSTQKDAS
jgi:surface carbohydrate biosynthesis protein